MKVTDVRLRMNKNEDESKLKAYADITLEDSFVIHGLKVIDGKNGMFVAMPSKKMPDGEFKDIAHPINGDFRKMITDKVIEEFNSFSTEELDA